jgi:N-acetyl-anhydromuramyl-L-alanine amidase AmpD
MEKEILIPNIKCNFNKKITEKKYILITDTLRSDFDKYIKSLEIKNYAPSYVIRKNGDIYKLYNDEFHSYFFESEPMNEVFITIALENAGLLNKNENTYTNWCLDIVDNYNIKEINENYYETYSDKQYESLSYIILYLCQKHNIQMHKIRVDNLELRPILLAKELLISSYSPNNTFDLIKLNEYF